jgi:hypothetical protein
MSKLKRKVRSYEKNLSTIAQAPRVETWFSRTNGHKEWPPRFGSAPS